MAENKDSARSDASQGGVRKAHHHIDRKDMQPAEVKFHDFLILFLQK